MKLTDALLGVREQDGATETLASSSSFDEEPFSGTWIAHITCKRAQGRLCVVPAASL